MTTPVKLIGFTRLYVPARENGDRVVGSFDIEVAGVRLRKCGLLLLADGRHVAKPPHFACRGGRSGRNAPDARRVEIVDQALKSEMTELAVAALRTMGGEA